MSSFLRRMIALMTFMLSPIAWSQETPDDARMSDYDVTHYDLSIAFDIPDKAFSGSVVMEAQALKTLPEVVLMASNRTLTIDSVLGGNERRTFSHHGDRLVIGLSSPITAQTPFSITVYYHGVSDFGGDYDDGGVYFSSSGRVATSSEPFFARTWWPCKDLPSDKATARITMTVPEKMTAVSNGLLTNAERHGGNVTYTWQTSYPIATYLVAVSAAEYKEFSATYKGFHGEEMPIRYFVFPEDYEKARKDFENTPDALAFFARRFCEYPFIKEKFGYVEVEGSLTMENQTICSIQDSLIRGDRRSELTLVHEMAHHWWGDLITPIDWHHTWLNEGFATYAEALYLEHTKGRDAYRQYMTGLMSQKVGSLAGSVVGKSDTAFWDSFSARVYVKGAIVLHMLRNIMGDNAFFGTMRDYLSNPRLRYANATTEDFVQTCERVSSQDLHWFFNQWVYASSDSVDRPVLSYSWDRDSILSHRGVILKIEQTTSPHLLFRLPLDVEIKTSHADKIFPIIDSLAVQSFTFILPEQAESLWIDKSRQMFRALVEKKTH